MSVSIFLSTVSDEFRDYRDQLRGDLTRHNVEVKVQEDFKDYGDVTLDKLDLYIANCDAVVHLVGDMTGSAAKPESTKAILAKYPDLPSRLSPLGDALARGIDISYTQWEAWLAIYHSKPLLIAQAALSAPRGPAYAPTDVSRAAQHEHVARLRAIERYPGSTFESPDQLAKQIAYTTILDRLADERAAAGARLLPRVSIGGVVGLLTVLLLAPLVADQWAKTLGVALAAPLVLVIALGILSLVLVYLRYFGLLDAGDAPMGSADRHGYDLLRASLAAGGKTTQIYSLWLTAFLDATDRFFGDGGMADRSLFPRAFGLRAPAALWTASAFDRCLFLALLYPVVTIYVLWAVSGHVGPAERAISLPGDFQGWERGLVVAALGSFALTSHAALHRSFWKRFPRPFRAFALVGPLLLTFAVSVAVPNLLAVVPVFALTAVFAGTLAIAVTGAVAVTFVIAFAVAMPFGYAIGDALAVPGTGDGFPVGGLLGFLITFVVTLAAKRLADMSIRRRRHGAYLIGILATMVSASLFGAIQFSSWSEWHLVGPMILFLCLLTLLNVPFDWASLGLTRALLRRGLELQGWWPFLLGLVDALLAGVIIALLALTMVLGIQAFDALAVHSGGKPVLGVDFLLEGIAARPTEPEYWWVYVLLLSTMIPSLFNLAISGTALMRGLPGLSSLLLRFMPVGCAVPAYDRAWIASLLTAQVALGVVLGVVVQGLLAYGLLVHVMPAVGLGLLDLCRNLVALDLPARLIKAIINWW